MLSQGRLVSVQDCFGDDAALGVCLGLHGLGSGYSEKLQVWALGVTSV